MTWEWDETLFAGAAPHYAVGRIPYPDGLEAALTDALGLDGTGTLLDVGCGPGTIALRLADRFAHVVGLDPDPGMLAEAARLADAAGIPNTRWVRARAEDLADHLHELPTPTVRVATLAQSFHWMDQPRVARTIHEVLDPDGGAFVHVGPGQTSGWLREGPPNEEIDELIVRYLGTTHRAGQGVRPTSPGGEERVLAALPFDGPERIVLDGAVHERTPEQLVHNVLSMSNAAPHLFGDRLDDFVHDLRTLLDRRPTYRVRVGDTLVRIWRRRSGHTPPMADDRIDRRAAHLLPEEDAAGGSDRPRAQAEAILEESDERQADRDAAPDSLVEHRTSDEATPPV